MSNAGLEAPSADARPPLNTTLSPSTSSGPRPLHLPLGSVVGSSSSPSTSDFNSSYPSPGPSSSAADSGADADPTPSSKESLQARSPITLNSPSSSTSRAAPPSPLSPSISGLRKHPNSRRQSSISYISSSSVNGLSPSTSQFLFNSKRQSVDAATTLLRSPLSSVHPTFGVEDAIGSGLSRSNSLGGGRGERGMKSPRSPNVGDRDRSSTGSIVPNQNARHLKERPPVTLAEKHAELLHFIAQKESKCLELRSQLAVHEAELLQLKRKWERIVNRGFEKSLSPVSTTSSSSNPSSTSHTSTSTSTHLLSTSPDDHTSFTTSSATGAGAAVVLEGIKEGVQGVSRLIAAGLESIVNVGPSSAASASGSGPSEAASGKSESTASVPPLPFKLGSITNKTSIKSKRQSYLGHEQKESQSSASSSSTRTSGTFSSLLSTGSAVSTTTTSTSNSSSASTSASLPSDSSSTSTTREGDADEDEFGDFESGQLASRSRSSPNSSLDDEHEQVLMVHDTGATPTMSPNPAFEKRRRKGERLQMEKLVLVPESSSLGQNEEGGKGGVDEFSWDDDTWGDDDHEQPLGSSLSPAASNHNQGQGHQKRPQPQSQQQQQHQHFTPTSRSQRNSSSTNPSNSRPKSPLAPMSSIPGLGMGMGMGMNMNMSAQVPSAQQVSSWVGSVGKRWGDIAKGGSTFVKNQKRASLLLSDMQQSIVSALGSPVSLSSTSTLHTANTNTKTPSSTSSSQPPNTPSSNFSSNASHTSHTGPASASSSSYYNSTSLLDGSDDESYGESSVVGVNSTPIMVPDSLALNGTLKATTSLKAPLVKEVKKATETTASEKGEDEDEWNW